jgi:tRNA-dihydrouridine synthase C
MLGRGIIADPYLARKIANGKNSTANAKNPEQIPWEQVLFLVVDLYRITEKQKSANTAVNRVKQWLRLLLKTYPEAEALFEKIKLHHDPKIFLESVAHLNR